MKVIYFYEETQMNRFAYPLNREFKHGVEFGFYDDLNYSYNFRIFLIPLMGVIIETYGADPARYEILINDEDYTYRIYFRDKEDQAACKLFYPGEWDPDPDWGEEDEED